MIVYVVITRPLQFFSTCLISKRIYDKKITYFGNLRALMRNEKLVYYQMIFPGIQRKIFNYIL